MTTRKPQTNLLTALAGAVLTTIAMAHHAPGAEGNATETKSAPEVTVNALAANPTPHLDKPVALLGVVGVVTPGKGFLMVDQREFNECGLSCLKETGTKKIPVRWNGAAPKVEESVRVEGVLTKSADGLAFTAHKWVKHGSG